MVAVHAGTHASGQGHETMYAQMVSGWMGVPLDRIRVFQRDTDRVLFGRGTFAARSAMVGGSALRAATDEVIAKGKRFVAWMLDAAPDEIDFHDGVFALAGTNRTVTLSKLARRCYNAIQVPAEFGVGLDGVGGYVGPPSFPNGCMICEVEVDPETGAVSVDRFVSVNDCGTIINPMMLEGQMHGSIAQAVG
jgi:carbon-monoxide dehydrogenase large subunit